MAIKNLSANLDWHRFRIAVVGESHDLRESHRFILRTVESFDLTTHSFCGWRFADGYA